MATDLTKSRNRYISTGTRKPEFVVPGTPAELTTDILNIPPDATYGLTANIAVVTQVSAPTLTVERYEPN